MERYYEYTDANDKRVGAIQKLASNSVRDTDASMLLAGDRILSHHVRVFGWKGLRVFPPSLSQADVMRKVNEVRKSNGDDPLYDDEYIRDAETDKETKIIRVNEDGSEHEVTTRILATSGEKTMARPVVSPARHPGGSPIVLTSPAPAVAHAVPATPTPHVTPAAPIPTPAPAK